MAGPAAAGLPGDYPTKEDADRGLRLVEELVSADSAALFAEALEVVWATTRKLADTPGSFGLIHGDLHYENFLFHRGAVRAIDFDDCGWGFHLYDLAVTLWDSRNGPNYEALRDALLAAYAQHRRLPDDHAVHLQTLFVLRRMQMLMWALESRRHARSATSGRFGLAMSSTRSGPVSTERDQRRTPTPRALAARSSSLPRCRVPGSNGSDGGSSGNAVRAGTRRHAAGIQSAGRRPGRPRLPAAVVLPCRDHLGGAETRAVPAPVRLVLAADHLRPPWQRHVGSDADEPAAGHGDAHGRCPRGDGRGRLRAGGRLRRLRIGRARVPVRGCALPPARSRWSSMAPALARRGLRTIPGASPARSTSSGSTRSTGCGAPRRSCATGSARSIPR